MQPVLNSYKIHMSSDKENEIKRWMSRWKNKIKEENIYPNINTAQIRTTIAQHKLSHDKMGIYIEEKNTAYTMEFIASVISFSSWKRHRNGRICCLEWI